jgi:hypothetical protein
MSVSLEYGGRATNAGLDRGVTRGAGLAVVNLAGELWIQRDNKGRARTGRRAGDLSIIFETEKTGEKFDKNVLGALPELVNDRTLSTVASHLVTTDGLQSTSRLYSENDGRPIDYAIAVVVFDGDPHGTFAEPFDVEEASPVGWMSTEQFLSSPAVRPLARHAVTYLDQRGILTQKIVEYHDPEHPKKLVIPRGFVVSDFYHQRESVRDMEPGEEYSFAH